jgi:GntR family transcriptional regulator, transcriptional repressor for pyruvate dehydrogenase complex
MDNKITPIKKTRVSEEVFRQLYRMIREGVFKPGDSLPSERELSEQFQVSRASVREAIRTLSTMGMINTSVGVGGGNFIKEVTLETIILPFAQFLESEEQTLEEMIEFRLVLETEIARIAASKRNEDDLQRIQEAVEGMEQDVAGGEIGLQGDNDFHDRIAAATHNKVFVHMLSLAKTLLSRTREATLSLTGVPLQGLKDHWAIYKAIESGDPDKSADLMRSHISHAMSNFRKWRGQSEAQPSD